MMLDYFYGQSGELFSYFRIPKALFQDCRFRQLSTDARTLYGILLDRMSLSVKNGWLDEQGRVYIIYTVREVQESLCCAEHKAVKLFRELEDMDLIERKRRGLGRPSLIYVKDFSSGLPKAQVQNCPNSNSCAAESAILVQPKPQANKTDKNKTERNDPDPIYSGGIREQLEDYFYQVLEVDLLLRLCPDDEDTIYQIVDLLVDGLQFFQNKGETTMEFFNSAIEVLQTLVVALGAGLGVWGAINLLEGYGNDNPGSKSQGMKQFMAN